MNKAIQQIPHLRNFKVGQKTIIKDNKIQVVNDDEENLSLDDSLNIDESRDLDNRMSGDKILRILRDYIIKENITIRAALGIRNITNEVMISKDYLKDQIKKIVGQEATYYEIMKALEHFHKISFEKK